MSSYGQNLEQERAHLRKTISFIKGEIERISDIQLNKRSKLISSRKDMWENTAHHTNDFTKLTEINQYLSELNSQTANYTNSQKRLDNYKAMVESPYFGRFDFTEDGFDSEENIYIGLHNVIDPKTHEVYVYDWRAPISSIFYRYELGKAEYDAPVGSIGGTVNLKRQYKIKNSDLEYFFDCSIIINDAILQEILSRNTSPKMRNIVETIQKEQDVIIRDTENELLIVQGVAGSGKTSVALHRVAFLLYDGLNSNLKSNNIIIISPNPLFSKYISNVLPELGEENVRQITFADLLSTTLNERFLCQTRDAQLESLINCQDEEQRRLKQEAIDFKGSGTFVKILDRLLLYYSRRMIQFKDVYFDGKVLMTNQQLKNRFLNNKTGIPMAKQLKRLENVILEKVHPLRRTRLEKIEQIVANSEGHELEIKQFARLLSIKEAKLFMNGLNTFLKVDYAHLYKLLFNTPGLLAKLANGLELPVNIDKIIQHTKENLNNRQVYYEDCAPLLYLKLKIEGVDFITDIKQVVIDEAQDYYPLQYEVFKLLFRDAKYTILGDINQSVEKKGDISIYDSICKIMNKQKQVQLYLTKGYRSSYEINVFARKLLGIDQSLLSFQRHEKPPVLVSHQSAGSMLEAISNDIRTYISEGYESVAVICKTQQEAKEVYSLLKMGVEVQLIQTDDANLKKGALVISSYLAKGLEFDVVIVYNVNKDNYSTELDQRLLYISCTRALHRLIIHYTGDYSPLLPSTC